MALKVTVVLCIYLVPHRALYASLLSGAQRGTV